MTTEEQLIEHLRSSLRIATANVFHRADLIDGVAPKRSRRLRLPMDGLGGLVAAGSALAVALFAVIVLSHGQRTAHAPAPATGQPDKPISLRGLRSELAILRRPQRPADRLPSWAPAAEQPPDCGSCLNVRRILGQETRLIATLRVPRSASHTGRERYYLVLGTVPDQWGNGAITGWRQHGLAIRSLHLTLLGVTSRQLTRPAPLEPLLNPVQIPMPAAALNPRDVLLGGRWTVGVVPDGVSRVKWELANPGQHKPAIVYPRLRGNVAVAPWTPAPVSTRLGNEQWLAGATWYAPDGRVIASFHDLDAINGEVHH